MQVILLAFIVYRGYLGRHKDKDLNGLVKDSSGDNALDIARQQRNNSRREKKTWNEMIQVLIDSLPDGDEKTLAIQQEKILPSYSWICFFHTALVQCNGDLGDAVTLLLAASGRLG